MSKIVAVLGMGSFGTAMAAMLSARPNLEVRLWSRSPESARVVALERENRPFLPGVHLPDHVCVTADPAEAVAGADLWLSAVPTAYLAPTFGRFAGLTGRAAVASLTKGIDPHTLERPSEILARVLGTQNVVVLSGPSHAEEVARNQPCSLVAASTCEMAAGATQEILNSEMFRVYTSPDPVGVELAGALKNVIALAAGVGDGLGFGDNAKSALLTRSLVEMIRYGVAHEAHPETFYGLAGVGDLITTCASVHGRNRRVGERLGRGESLDAILAEGRMVAEGVATAKSAYARSQQLNLKTPIICGVYRILYEKQPPAEALRELMATRPGGERL